MLGLANIVFISIGLAMDAFAVSVSSGFSIEQKTLKNALKIALFFGFFQAAMPLMGWYAGLGFRNIIEPLDHWIVFGILGFIGIKMIHEAVNKNNNKECLNPLKFRVLIGLSFATSIDALAVGIGFALLKTSILFPIFMIGTITFILSLLGFYAGCFLGKLIGKGVEILGGIILIFMGVKILIKHLFA